MRRIIYKKLLGLPASIFSVSVSGIGLAGTFWPVWVKETVDAGMSAETIRYIGIALVAWGFLHLILLWLLKPTDVEPGNGGITQTSNGPNSPVVQGGSGNTYYFGPAAPDESAKASGSNYDIAKLTNGLNKVFERFERDDFGRRPPNNPLGLATYKRSPPKPDYKLDQILSRIYAQVRENLKGTQHTNQTLFEKVDREIADVVSLHDLTVWGRLFDRPIEVIPKSVLKNGRFRHKQGEFQSPPVDTPNWLSYTDIKFNKKEIEGKWPKT